MVMLIHVLIRGVGKNLSRGGGVLDETFQKGSLCTDLFPNTLCRKCIKFTPHKKAKGGGGSRTTPLTHPFKFPPLLLVYTKKHRGGCIRGSL